jgi:hypothetical protein
MHVKMVGPVIGRRYLGNRKSLLILALQAYIPGRWDTMALGLQEGRDGDGELSAAIRNHDNDPIWFKKLRGDLPWPPRALKRS